MTQHAYFTRLFLSFILSQYHVVSTYTSKCNFIDSHKKSMASAVQKLMKLRNAQQNYVQISDTKLHPNRKVNVENEFLVNDQRDAQILFYIFISVYNSLHVSSLLPTCTHLGHHQRMTVTRGCINKICLS